MDELAHTLLQAFHRILPQLQADPEELSRRLARRHTPTLTRPPRAWCLAVRASDTRINPATALIDPPHAAYPASHLANGLRPTYAPHTLTLTRDLLERLAAPVQILTPGEDHLRVARNLGRHPESLRPSRRKGPLATHTVPHLGGRRGKPVPLLFAPSLLNPNTTNHFLPPDPHFKVPLSLLPQHLPEDFYQDVTRLPSFRPYPKRPKGYRNDVLSPTSQAQGLQSLGPRHSERSEESKPSDRAIPTRFRGWLFVCPGCRRHVKFLYLPLPTPNLPQYLNLDPASLDIDAPPTPPPTFACHKCHRIRFFSRTNVKDAWNHLVAHLSAGLLFGHEVPRPASFTPLRRRPVRPHLNRPPSQRRQQILHLLTTTPLTYKQIAAHLGVGYPTVHHHTKTLYRQHNVTTRQALTLAVAPDTPLPDLPPLHPSPKYTEVVKRHRSGHSPAQIAQSLGLSPNAVRHHLKRFRRDASQPRATKFT